LKKVFLGVSNTTGQFSVRLLVKTRFKKKHMKTLILILGLLPFLSVSAQDVSFFQTTTDTVFGSELEKIYQCYGGLVNHSSDSMTIRYTRYKNELSASNLFSGFCTDILCYFVSDELVIEKIPPLDTHKIEIRWAVRFEEIAEGLGSCAWQIVDEDSGVVIDTFHNVFYYSSMVTSLDDIERNSLRISPNPVTDLLTLPFEVEGEIVVYNTKGTNVLQLALSREKFIAVSSLPIGTYFGTIKHADGVYKFTFIKV